MPKDQLEIFLKKTMEKYIKRELKANNVPENVIEDYAIQLTEQDYKDLVQDAYNFLVQYGTRILN